MAQLSRTEVIGQEEVLSTMVKRVKKFLMFRTPFWEEVALTHTANDIYITTDREIRYIYLNGEVIN